jgi:hypothetical protein
MAQMTISIWKALDVPHKFELQQVWVHVEGVLHIVRHFLGLWVVGSLIGTTLDVDLFSLRSLGVVRIFVAMMEPKNLDKMNELQGYACLGVSVMLQLKVMISSFIASSRTLSEIQVSHCSFGSAREMMPAIMVQVRTMMGMMRLLAMPPRHPLA